VCSESLSVTSAQEPVRIYQATLDPSQLFVGVIKYSLPHEVSQLKRVNLSVVTVMEPQLGAHEVGAESRSLLHSFSLSLSILSVFLSS